MGIISIAKSSIQKDKSALTILTGVCIAMFLLLIGLSALLVTVGSWIIVYQDSLNVGMQEIITSLSWGLLGVTMLLLSASIIKEFIIIFPKQNLDYKIILVVFLLLSLIATFFIFYVFFLIMSDILFPVSNSIFLD